jgi:hypothetical protein
MILAGLSILGGFLGIPHASWLEHWLTPVVGEHHLSAEVSHSMELFSKFRKVEYPDQFIPKK